MTTGVASGFQALDIGQTAHELLPTRAAHRAAATAHRPEKDSMYGDTEVIRKHVTRLREQGADIRTMADNMVGQVEGIAWSGRAADTMRERMRERASRLREAAGRHDTAADSLEKHLLEVDTTKESIATTQRRATAMIADAQGRIASIQSQAGLGSVGDVRRVPDPADEELAAFTPPEPGHKDWLAVDLPGLSAGS